MADPDPHLPSSPISLALLPWLRQLLKVLAVILILSGFFGLGHFATAGGVSLWVGVTLREKRIKQKKRLANFGRAQCNSCGHVGILANGDEVQISGMDWDFYRVCEKCGSENWVRIKENESSSESTTLSDCSNN